MIHNSDLIIYTDGGARGNPGPAAVGVVVCDLEHTVISEHKKYLGVKTNNQAEYEAVLLALEEALKLGAASIKFYLDSELVVKQLRGQYKIKNQGIAPLAEKVLALSNNFSSITYTHIPREKNQHADKLVNQALDENLKKR
ncbi:MAG: ribonuclease HI family protein [Patescibacteria group bacterium]